jgi:putative DNA primase/helicase
LLNGNAAVNNNPKRAVSALQALDAGTNRDTWVHVAMAAKDAGVTLEDFTEWSRPAPNFGSEHECATLWRSIKDGPIKAGTLYGMAHSMGWTDPGTGRVNGHRAFNNASTAPTIKRIADTSQRPAIAPLDVWNRCKPAPASHPYIIAKRGSPEGLRVVPADDSLTIGAQSLAGWLVVPVLSMTGELQTLQFIPSPGDSKKMNLPGASFSDGFFSIGNLTHSPYAYIVEGIGQAWACHNATGIVAIVCFGSGRMATVAQALRRCYNAMRLILVCDRGQESKAEAIAKDVRAEWVEMQVDKPANYDANDYAAEYGIEALAKLLAAPRVPLMHFRVLSAAEIMSAPPLQWRVRGVLPTTGLACVYGASGSGKSFLTLDLCASIAAGKDWFDCRVKAAPVVYVALEGEAGFSQRMKAWKVHRGHEVPDTLEFIKQGFDLRDAGDVAEIAAAANASGCAGGVLVIDTLNRAACGADENTSRDMGELIDACKRLQTELSGLVLLVHHSGKDQSKGLRGHSSLYAALDAAIEVTRNGDRREWAIDKAKDGTDGERHAFNLKVVDVGLDDDGEPITSCAVIPDNSPINSRRLKLPHGGTQKIVYDALGPVLRQSEHFGKSGAPAGRPCVEIEAAILACADRLPCRADQRKFQTQRAINSMVANGIFQTNEGWLWQT